MLRGVRYELCALQDCNRVYEVQSSHKRQYCSQACAHKASIRKRRARMQKPPSRRQRVKPRRTNRRKGRARSMALSKRGVMYWYEFCFGGKRYRRSTGVANQRVAWEIKRAYRTALAKGEVGITERKSIPTFRAVIDGFPNWAAEMHKKSTPLRYKTSSIALLRHFRDTALDRITPEDLERFKTARASERTTVRGTEKRLSTKKESVRRR
jgi:hypothetical protein